MHTLQSYAAALLSISLFSAAPVAAQVRRPAAPVAPPVPIAPAAPMVPAVPVAPAAPVAPFEFELEMKDFTVDLSRDFAKDVALKAAFEMDKMARAFAQSQKPQPGRGPMPRPVVAGRGDNNEDRLYQNGVRALDNARWDEAIENFTRVVQLGGSRADGATYWIAWVQAKQGNGAAALDSLAKFSQSYPQSRWVNEVRSLAVEIRQAAGQPVRPEAVADDELKLMALNSLVRADEQRAIPIIEKILKGTGGPRLKERALFVLAQTGTPQARQIVAEMAKGGGNPDLQAKAVVYLGAFGGVETRQTLSEIYKGSSSFDVKRSILRAFQASGDRERLLDVARTEQAPELRAEAVQVLGSMGAQDELFQLYQKESSPDVRRRIIQSMFASHSQDRLIQLLKMESDEGLRRSIVQNLGQISTTQSTDALVALYGTEKDQNVRRSIIDAFANQRNVKVLIALANKETDPDMKKRILERMGNMKSAEATDYFLELLSK